ncbi:hypothetical protein R6Q59_001836 [Mikania micrantha]
MDLLFNITVKLSFCKNNDMIYIVSYSFDSSLDLILLSVSFKNMVIKPRNLVLVTVLVAVVVALSSVHNHTDLWQKLIIDATITHLLLPFKFKKSKTAPKS